MKLNLKYIHTGVNLSSKSTSNYYGASNIINDERGKYPEQCSCCTGTYYNAAPPHWIQLDLGKQYPVAYILIKGLTGGEYEYT